MKVLPFLVFLAITTGCAHLRDTSAADLQAASSEALVETPAELEALDQIAGVRADGYEMVTILNYHDFREASQTPLQITPKQFEEQMQYLKENGFHVVSLENFYDFIDLKFKLPEKAVVITIDDGWRSTYTVAYPILRKYGFTATIFIYTDFIAAQGPGALTWEMLKEMMENGMDVQAHSKTHQFKIPWKKEEETEEEYQKRIEKELAFPVEMIQKRLGNKVQYIAYPFGQFSEPFIEAARKIGYRGGLTVTGATVKEGAIIKKKGNPVFIDPFEVRRVQIMGGTSLTEFAKKLKPFEEQKIYDGRYDYLFQLPEK